LHESLFEYEIGGIQYESVLKCKRSTEFTRKIGKIISYKSDAENRFSRRSSKDVIGTLG